MTALSDRIVEPDFIERNGEAIVDAMIDTWQAAVGKPLYPAQVERLLINLVAYRELLLRLGIQDAAKLNLVAYSRFPMLDLLGELVGTYRLPPAAATTRLRFTLAQATDTAVPIGKGILAAAYDRVFITTVDAEIPAGQTSVEVGAAARDAGSAGNGVRIGGIDTILSLSLTANVSVANTTVTAGGADIETDERLRQRILLSPERYSSAGPVGAYRYHVVSLRQDIIDVGIVSPAPGRVDVYPLMADGLPDASVLSLVLAALSADTVRPLTDRVEVHAPVRVPYTVSLAVTTHRGANATETFSRVERALEDFADELRQTVGRNLAASEWIASIQAVPGVQSCRLIGFVERVLDASMWPDCTGFTVLNDGESDD